MTNLSSVVQPAILHTNKLTIHNFLRQSYTQVAHHMQESVNYLQDGVSFFKSELFEMYKQAENYMTQMMLPVNNFLKEPGEIENDFLLQADNGPGYIPSCNFVPLEIALQSPMEENL